MVKHEKQNISCNVFKDEIKHEWWHEKEDADDAQQASNMLVTCTVTPPSDSLVERFLMKVLPEFPADFGSTTQKNVTWNKMVNIRCLSCRD